MPADTRGLKSLKHINRRLPAMVELAKSEGSPRLHFELANHAMLLEQITNALEQEIFALQTMRTDVVRAIFKAGKDAKEKP